MIANNTKQIFKNTENKSAWVSNINLIIVAFTSVFYIRIINTTISAPSILDHVHFVLVPSISGIILMTANSRYREQIELVKSLSNALFIFAIAVLLSAFFNENGVINAVASFMMLGEPIMFLIAVVCVPMTLKSFTRIRKWFMYSVAINFLLAAVQKPLINAHQIYAEGFNGTDGCGGVFFVSGAGNYVSAAVSLTAAIYFLARKKTFPLWIRIAVFVAAFWQVLFSDSKQLVFAYIVAWLLLALFSFQNIGNAIKVSLGLVISSLIFYWCIHNIESFRAYTSWARPELYGVDGDAWYAKLYSVRVILSEFHSPINWLFGLGPGHTVSRLGAWFLQDYKSILAPLGATYSNIGVDAREFVDNFWLTKGSSVFSPIFGWAGIWGDLGLVGLSTYIYLCRIIWQNFASNNSLKIIMYSILVLGFIFTQMEEPGYMVSVAMLLGLAWQEKQIKSNNRELRLQLKTNHVVS